MIKTQIIREGKKPIAVLIDYNRYLELIQLEEDKSDYQSAMKVKMTNKKWISQEELEKELGIATN